MEIDPRTNLEHNYLKLCKKILDDDKEGRIARNGIVHAVFDETLHIDLSYGFPLLTTKKMFWRGIVEELLFFLKGSTDSKILADKGVHIWDGNTTKEFLAVRKLPYEVGDMGPIYGWCWRHFGAKYEGKDADYTDKGFDQLREVLSLIKNKPTNRSMVMTTFDPSKAKESVLPPCHSLVVQFFVKNKELQTIMYQRSSDTFLGLPFNIASTSLLACLIAKVSGLIATKVTIHLGDTHIYHEHIDAVNEQGKRKPFPLPKLIIEKEISKDSSIDEKIHYLETITFEDITVDDYECHPKIKAVMVV
jgi:thymidylate synthase